MSTLSLDAFWSWLLEHPNCIVRAGSPDSVLCDDEDYHWWLGNDNDVLIAQMVRGKRLVGELIIDPERTSYVEGRGEQQESEHLFELIGESEQGRFMVYFFVLAHGLENEEQGRHSGAVH